MNEATLLPGISLESRDLFKSWKTKNQSKIE